MAKAIFISGVIGSGKTTLAEKLSKNYELILKKENIKDDTVVPKIHHLYSTFDPQTIFEVQYHFLEDSAGMSDELIGDGIYVFDTYPFVSQMVFLESLRSLHMITEEQFLILRDKLNECLKPTTLLEHLHIHCTTPKDIFTRILNRKSFESHSFDSYGKPNPDLIRLLEELDTTYYNLALTPETIFPEDPTFTRKIKSFVYGN